MTKNCHLVEDLCAVPTTLYPHGHGARMRFLSVAFCLVLVGAVWGACGAEGRPGPNVASPSFDDAVCPGAEEALRQTQAALEQPELRAMRPHLGDILMRDGGLRLALPLIVATARELEGRDFATLVSGHLQGRGLSRLSPHIEAILGHVLYKLESEPEIGRAPVEAAWQVLTRCDSIGTLRSVAKIVSLDVSEGQEGESWVLELLRSVAVLEAHPQFQDWVARLRLAVEDKETEEEAAGRGAVLRLARLLVANLASPDFDPSYLRSVLEDFLLAREDQSSELRTELIHLLDLMLYLIQPEFDILPAVQSVAGCVNDVDPEAAIVGLLFDLVFEGSVDLRGMSNDLQSLMEEEEGDAARRVLLALGRVVEQQTRVAGDLVVKFAEFISPDLYRLTLPAVQELIDNGVFGEWMDVVARFMYGCAGDAP